MGACQGTQSKSVEHIKENQAVPPHPRILLLNNEEEKIQIAIKSDSTWRAMHDVIIKECDKLVTKPLVEYELEGRRLLEVSRECRKRLFYLSYAYRTTGQERYLVRAEKELLNVSGFSDWNPSHFLDVAEMTWAVSLSYDWLYDDLSESSRQQIETAIIKLGLEPSFNKEYNFWLAEDNNWNQVCNASMVFGALAIYDKNSSLARKVINRAIESIQLSMKVYEPDGAYPEGYMYWSYGTTFNVYLIDALVKAFESDFGLSKKPGFLKTAGYMTHMVGPSGMNFNYSDGDSKSMLSPVMFWYAGRLNNNTSLISEMNLARNKSDLPWQKDLPAIMIWGAIEGILKIEKPSELIWVGQGKNPVALMRSAWEKNAIYVGLKGGSAYNNHGHMDVGSFVMDALGERWAMDFGSQNYNSLESKGINIWSNSQESQRWQVFRFNNLAHNTLTFDHDFQLVKGHAPIISHTTGETFLSAVTDLTGVYNNHVSNAIRGVAIVSKEYVVIRDEIELSGKTDTLRWNMLTSATVKITGRNKAELIQKNKRLLIEVTEPENAELVTWSTRSPHDYDEPNPGTTFVGFKLKGDLKERIVLEVLLIPVTGHEIQFQKTAPVKEWKNR